MNGMPFFGGLRSGRKARAYVIVFQVFDLLYLDGQSLITDLCLNKTVGGEKASAGLASGSRLGNRTDALAEVV